MLCNVMKRSVMCDVVMKPFFDEFENVEIVMKLLC
jgi:hypothetical protein